MVQSTNGEYCKNELKNKVVQEVSKSKCLCPWIAPNQGAGALRVHLVLSVCVLGNLTRSEHML